MKTTFVTGLFLLALVFVGPVLAQTSFDCHSGLGHTKGFWSNRNGRAVLAPNDTAWRDTLNNLHLVDADGNDYDLPTGGFNATHADFRSWILGPVCGNMAYILSQQMTALVLNLEYGPMNAANDPHVDWMGSKVQLSQLIDDANDLLRDFPLTKTPSAERDMQEQLKDLFDALNNNQDPICEPESTEPPPSNVASTSSASSGEPGSGGDAETPGAGCVAGAPIAPAAILFMAFVAWSRRQR